MVKLAGVQWFLYQGEKDITWDLVQIILNEICRLIQNFNHL